MASTTHKVQPEAQDENSQHEIQALRAEVSHLKALLSKTRLGDDVTESLTETATLHDMDAITPPRVSTNQQMDSSVPADLPERTSEVELWSRSPRSYYRQHSLFQFFFEVSAYPLCSTFPILTFCRSRNCSHSSRRRLMSGSNLVV